MNFLYAWLSYVDPDFLGELPICVHSLRPHLLTVMHCKKSRVYEMKAILNASSCTTMCVQTCRGFSE